MCVGPTFVDPSKCKVKIFGGKKFFLEKFQKAKLELAAPGSVCVCLPLCLFTTLPSTERWVRRSYLGFDVPRKEGCGEVFVENSHVVLLQSAPETSEKHCG